MLTLQYNDEAGIQGSSSVFNLFRIANIIMMFLGALIGISSIYAYITLQTFNSIEVSLVLIGFYAICLGFAVYSLKDSLPGLTVYIVAALFFLLIILIITMIISSSNEVFGFAKEKADPSVISTVDNQIRAQIKFFQWTFGLMLLFTVEIY